jgi:Holliday junction resolvasome RuvABC endonuclease subunit
MVIGLDPGTATLGFSVVSGNRLNPEIVDYGIIQTRLGEQSLCLKDLPKLARTWNQF